MLLEHKKDRRLSENSSVPCTKRFCHQGPSQERMSFQISRSLLCAISLFVCCFFFFWRTNVA